jgi:site-specific DNA-methyltransferase (adenine-specific)
MLSSRNKTLFVTDNEIKKFHDYYVLPNKTVKIADFENKLIFGNALKILPKLPDSFVDLIITDPPYNNEKDFGRGTVKLAKRDFENWCDQWIKECFRLLKPTGSIYICIDWQNSSLIEKLLNKYFVLQNRITWKREKGRGAQKNWKNNMEDIWFATKSKDYTFNIDSVKLKKTVIAPYVDKQGQAKDWFEENGQKFRYTYPSNIWTDLTVPFWSMPENTEHPTQKPEKLVERLILASSNPNDLVLDLFSGSGTTAVVAQKMKRKYCVCEIEKKYYILTKKRLTKE